MEKINVHEVVVPDGRRRIGDVSELAKSIAEVGLLNPITVRRTDIGFVLVAGGHRLEAVKSLGWEEVPCVVVDLCVMRAELAELDENLLRNEGTALERGEWMARRKVVYELLHPETAHGGDRRSGQFQDEIISSRSFADDTASKIGQSGRTIQHDVQIGSIPEAVRETLRETPAADRKVDLLKLARVKEPEEQQAIAHEMADGAKFDEAIRKVRHDPMLGAAQAKRGSGGDAVSYSEDYDSDEWYTPAQYVEAAREVLGGIDLDPASCDIAQQTVRAARHMTKDDDGLSLDWTGRVWLNPPYSQPAAKLFAAKLLQEFESGAVEAAIVVQNASTDAAWWHDLARIADRICVTRGRINFSRADGGSSANRYGQTFFYFGQHGDTFGRVFSQFGLVGVLR